MNKIEERISVLQAELDTLKGELERSKKTSLLPVDRAHFSCDVSLNRFPDKATAQAYADAFSVMLELRRQPGSQVAKDNVGQWVLRQGTARRLYPKCYSGLVVKTMNTSPCFATEADALAAIAAVGEDRILAMFKTLHGVA